MPRLTNRQKKAFGFSQQLTDPLALCLLKMTNLFESVDKSNFQLESEGQYYDDFMGMKGTLPNFEGTGRIDFSNIKKVQIGFIHKGKKKTYSESFISMIGKFMTMIYGVPTSFRQLNLKVVKGGIQDTSRSLLYHIDSSEGMLDALMVLDVLIDIQSQDQLLIAFIENQIHEEGSSIYGRACANRVGIIDLSIKDQKQLLIQTVIHQSLHTFGFDHCVAWKCLMNPYVAGQLWLCPCCLRKLLSENKKTLKKLSEQMVELCQEYSFEALKKSKKINYRIIQVQKESVDDR